MVSETTCPPASLAPVATDIIQKLQVNNNNNQTTKSAPSAETTWARQVSLAEQQEHQSTNSLDSSISAIDDIITLPINTKLNNRDDENNNNCDDKEEPEQVKSISIKKR